MKLEAAVRARLVPARTVEGHSGCHPPPLQINLPNPILQINLNNSQYY